MFGIFYLIFSSLTKHSEHALAVCLRGMHSQFLRHLALVPFKLNAPTESLLRQKHLQNDCNVIDWLFHHWARVYGPFVHLHIKWWPPCCSHDNTKACTVLCEKENGRTCATWQTKYDTIATCWLTVTTFPVGRSLFLEYLFCCHTQVGRATLFSSPAKGSKNKL